MSVHNDSSLLLQFLYTVRTNSAKRCKAGALCSMVQTLGVNIRVQLINPPMTLSSKNYLEVGGSAPLGLAFLAAVLSENGHDVRIIDCPGLLPLPVQLSGDLTRCGMKEVEILELVKEFEPDIIGMTCHYTATASDSVTVAELLKRQYSDDIPVALGGSHASICPAKLLKSPFVDFVAVGEGELTMSELCTAIESGADPAAVGSRHMLQKSWE